MAPEHGECHAEQAEDNGAEVYGEVGFVDGEHGCQLREGCL